MLHTLRHLMQVEEAECMSTLLIFNVVALVLIPLSLYLDLPHILASVLDKLILFPRQVIYQFLWDCLRFTELEVLLAEISDLLWQGAIGAQECKLVDLLF